MNQTSVPKFMPSTPINALLGPRRAPLATENRFAGPGTQHSTIITLR